MKLKIKCWVKLKSGRVERRKYKSVDGARFNGPGGIYDGPDDAKGEILHYKNWLGIETHVAYYHEGTFNPIRVNSPQDTKPENFGPADMENIHGDFIPSLLREALMENDKLKILMIVSVVVSCLSLLAMFVTAYWVHQVINYIHAH